MASLRALNLTRASRYGFPSTSYGRASIANPFKQQRRLASFYNADVAGLTEDEAEVFYLEGFLSIQHLHGLP